MSIFFSLKHFFSKKCSNLHKDFFFLKKSVPAQRQPPAFKWHHFFWLKGMLHICNENYTFTNLVSSKHCLLEMSTGTELINYIILFGEWEQLKGIVCSFAFSSTCCIFFDQLLRFVAQTASLVHSTLFVLPPLTRI